MIPRVETGASFRGAGLYYLHDKGTLESSQRVAWTYTKNCLHDEPDRALDEMWHTAENQQWLKQQSGNRIDGRPSNRPVMTISLSWPKEERPPRAVMLEAADSYLEKMGWAEHQALYVCHNDTAHRHVHIVLNKVHHLTGMSLDDGFTKRRSQEWALEYERERGKIYCLKRVENEERERGETLRPKQRGTHARHYGEWLGARDEMQKEGVFTAELQGARNSVEWNGLRADQRQEREAFWKESGDLRRTLRREIYARVSEDFKPDWQAYEERKAAADKERRAHDRHMQKEIKAYLQLSKGVKGDGYHAIMESRREFRDQLFGGLKELRNGIKERQAEKLAELQTFALDRFSKDRAKIYEQQLKAHREEKKQLREDQKAHRPRHDLIAREYDPTQKNTANENAQQKEAAAERAKKIANENGMQRAAREEAERINREAEKMAARGREGHQAGTAPDIAARINSAATAGEKLKTFSAATALTGATPSPVPHHVRLANELARKKEDAKVKQETREWLDQRSEGKPAGKIDMAAARKATAEQLREERERAKDGRSREDGGGGRTRGGGRER